MYGSEDAGSETCFHTPTTGMHKREFRESSAFNKLYGPIVSFFSLFRQDSVLISSGMHSGILSMYLFFEQIVSVMRDYFSMDYLSRKNRDV